MDTSSAMKPHFFAALFVFLAALVSHPTFAQTGIKNFHTVDTKGQVLRGGQPGKKISELVKLKVTNVVIVKNQLNTEVDDEIQALKAEGIRSDVFPLEWKEGMSLSKACHHVIDAVQTIQKYKRAGKKVFFHCTAGEDRTGLVAGLFRMVDQGWTSNKAFKQEMCANRYSDGAGDKPKNVTDSISKTLTPIFVALGKSITDSGSLNPSVCAKVRPLNQTPTCASVSE